MSYRVVNGKIVAVQDIIAPKSSDRKQNIGDNKFSDLLKKELSKQDGFVISNHAAERLKERNISFNENDMKRINEAINKAQDKGAKDSLILYKDVALLTSIKNRTVITAMDKNNNEDMVVTKIDSVVLL